jgi:amino acid adenylation domain-containing protein
MKDISTSPGGLSAEKRRLLELRLRQKGIHTPGARTISRRTETGPCVLSYAQQRVWFLDQLLPGSAAYLISSIQKFHGKLYARALEQSLETLVHRHESLRTIFAEQAGQPVQIIQLPTRYKLPVIDLQGLKSTQREQEARRLARQEAQCPCDLTRGPLLRTYLLRLEEQEHICFLTLHHIVTDGWSNEVLVRELTTLYHAFVAGQPSPLAPLPIQYADYALWQRNWLQGEVLAEQLAYWHKQLAGVSPLNLPSDHSRPAIQTYRGDRETVLVPAPVLAQLQALSRQEDATLFMLLLAAFQVLLLRYTGQEDICVGTPIANRSRPETEGIIGFFVNTLVMRGTLTGDPTFLQLLRQVREVCLQAYAHQDIPFEKVVEELEPERDLSRSPLFQVMFELQAASHLRSDWTDIRIESLTVERTNSKFDLTFALAETDQGLYCTLEYSTDLFEAGTIRRMLNHWQNLLQGLVQAPQSRLSELPLLSGQEQALQLVQWNATQTEFPLACTVCQLFEQQVQQRPDAIALVFEGAVLTYGELNRRANLLAHSLRQLGVGPEVLVGICVERSLDMVIGILGILKAGGAYVPLDPTYPPDRLAYMQEDSGLPVLVTQSSLAECVPGRGLKVVFLDAERSTLEQQNESNPEALGNSENLAYVIYTSGSTGRPKGVQILHRAVVNFLTTMSHQPGLTAKDTLLAVTTLSFDIAALELFLPLIVGACVVVANRSLVANGAALVEELERSGVTTMQATPVTWRLLLLAGWQGKADLKILCGGEALPRELARQILPRAASLWNMYGPTETTIWSTISKIELEDNIVTIGRPIANTQIYLLDPHMQSVPIGVPGELYIGGEGLARGYLNRSDLTAERFVPHPWSQNPGERLYRTGDLVRYRKDGALEFVGRKDGQVKLRGYRIELGEIEAALRQHSGIQDCIVLVKDDVTDKRLVAYLLMEPGSSFVGNSLRSYLQDYLPSYMIPSTFVPLDAFPLTPNGKLDRQALLAFETEQHEGDVAQERVQTPLEELLVGLWCEVLKRKQVKIHDNFFDLGGHSLLTTQLIARLRAILGVEVSVRMVFEAPTVAGLAQQIEQLLSESEGIKVPPLVALERPQEIPLSFAQQRLWFLDQLQPGNAAYLVPQAQYLPGSLNVEALEKSLAEIIRRHESLRTTFMARAGQPLQVIHPVGRFCLPLIDISDLEQESKMRTAQHLAAQEAQHPFDLGQGPLLRTHLLRLAHTEHILLLTLHHIITDGWSNLILRQELLTLYRSFEAGQPSPLAPLPIQYADYALWQRQSLQGQFLEAQLDYWIGRLGGLPSIELPADYPRPAVVSSRGAIHRFSLSEDLSQSLKALCRQEGVTLFMTLLTAFQILFYRYTSQSDIVIGTDSANRHHVETEGVVGFFVNLLVLRTDLSGKPTFREALQRVREVVLGAYAHQDTPFELLVEKLASEHYPGLTPLVQVLFVLQNIPIEVESDADAGQPAEHNIIDPLSIRPRGDAETKVKFDLALFMWEKDGRLSGALNYRLDLFQEGSMETMMARFVTLLQSCVAQPDLPIDFLDMTSDAERIEQEREERKIRQELRSHDAAWLDFSGLDFA